MPKKKIALTDSDPPEATPFYYVRVPTSLLKRVERKRAQRMHNKTAVVLTMIDLYLSLPEPLKPHAV